jgi:hypothetical protein
VRSIWWNENWQRKPLLGRNLSQCHFIHHRSNMTWPGIEPGRRGGKPASNRLIYSMVFASNLVRLLCLLFSNSFTQTFSWCCDRGTLYLILRWEHNLISWRLFLIHVSTATCKWYCRLIVINFWKAQSQQLMRYSSLVNGVGLNEEIKIYINPLGWIVVAV